MSESIEGQRLRIGGSRRRVAPVVLGLAGALALLAGGCGRSDEASQTIANTRNTLEALALGGAAPRSMRETKYREIVAALTPIAQGQEGETVSLAQALLGEALAGQGELAADTYRLADQDLLRAVSAASAALNLYIEQRALEASLKGYDPAPDIAEFDRLIQERERERAAAEQALKDTLAKRDALLSDASKLAAQAQGLRVKEAELRTQASSTAAPTRLPIVESAQRIRREWETLLKQAEELRIQTGLYDPVAAEIELEVKQAERRIASLDHAKQMARERAEWLREASASAGQSAQEAAKAASSAIEAVLTALNDGSRPTFTEAAGKYEQSLARVSAARGTAARAGATLSTGAVAHALGSLRREQGESLARVATLLETAGSVQPSLAQAKEFASAAAQLREESKELLLSAAEAYERAASSFESRGAASEDVAARMTRLAEEISAVRRQLTGEPEPQPEAEQGAETPADEASAALEEMSGHTGEGIAVPEDAAPAPEEQAGEQPDEAPTEPTEPSQPN
jgi:uncharacterized coiled-coil DUF342 family protein